ncbi:MFS transporter [Murinocardiopsis flavida]|uniref:MFS transporter n=1 Tax=Murinocardiopsis flavida TaxID=645275 RepID=UPI001B804192|nr:MFS transporter [Murinocardiopsis flavida]
MARSPQDSTTVAAEPSSGMAPVAVLALGVFAVGTGEFVLAGLLPMLVDAFRISVADAGQIVTVFALTCAVSGPVLTALTTAWTRRTVLLTATLIYLLGSAGSAMAGTYGQLMAAQVIAAAGVGLYIPNASATAASLVPPRLQGRAIALVVTGFTAAVAFGAPVGTALGGMIDWRATLWFASLLAAVGLAGVALAVPRDVAVPDAGGFRDRLRPLGDRRVLALLATTLVAFTAVFIPYTYISAIYAPATGGSSVALASLMLVGGVAGAVGNLSAGYFTDRWGGSRVVAAALVLLTAGMLLVPFSTTSMGAAVPVIAFYAAASFAITTPQQHRIISLRPAATPVLLSLNQSVLYLAIAASGVVGAGGIQSVGPRYVSLIAAAAALVALAFSAAARRMALAPERTAAPAADATP